MFPVFLHFDQLARAESGGDGLAQVITAVAAQAPSTDALPLTLPVLPIRNAVLFPNAVVPLTIGRASSRKLLDSLPQENGWVAVFTQKNVEDKEPTADDLYTTGVAAQVLRVVKQSDDTVVAIVSARERVRIRETTSNEPFLTVNVEYTPTKMSAAKGTARTQWEAAVASLRESALKLLALKTEIPEQIAAFIRDLNDGAKLADFIAGGMDIETADKQAALDELDAIKRVRLVQRLVGRQIQVATIQERIQKNVQSQFTDAQRKAYLHEQIRVIQKELGHDEDGPGSPADELREKLAAAAPPQEVLDHAERELRRLEFIPEGSPEFGVISTYLETLAALPWNTTTEDNLDWKRARRILDQDHHGLEKVKRRLLEHLAVRKLNPEGHSPILCLVGPPGVGKTSLGQSIADALGRVFVRVSLGGVRDEADIRGHRRTYIGAMAGRLMEEIRRAGTRNPVVMLDELDKLGHDFRGDPSSALLEVLDPKQNHAFTDHYLDVPFDLSQVLFLGTANSLDPIPGPLRDRLEIVELTSYTDREKLTIAKRYLLKRQLKEHGIKPAQCHFTTEGLEHIISHYTREAGVRELERQIAAVCRAVAARIAEDETLPPVHVAPAYVEEQLGPPKFLHDERLHVAQVGIATGLAWTSVGGEILHIEALRFPGKGQVQLTGQLGEVMKESVQAAWSLLRSRAAVLSIDQKAFSDYDVHVHVPAGATPKDGPSAGIAMFTALTSLFCHRPVRADVAMTGEISLRGAVLPIGGLKEKLLAAVRAGVKTVLIPHENEKDLVELPAEAKKRLTIIPVRSVDEVLPHVFAKPLKGEPTPSKA